MDNLSIPSADGSNKALQRAKSFDDRPLNVLIQQQNADPAAKAVNSLLVPDAGPSARKQKRQSINPALVMSFNNLQEASQDNPFCSTPSTPLYHLDPPATPVKYEHEHGYLSSPLEDNVSRDSAGSSPSNTHDVDANKIHTSNISPTDLDATQERPAYGRSHSSSSSEQHRLSQISESSLSISKSPMRLSITLDRLPTRTTSRPENRTGSPMGYAPDGGRRTSQFVSEGRVSPSLNVPNGKGTSMIRKGSLNNRQRNSSSSLTQTMELPPTPGSASGPTSPSHRVDVPHGVESGTDTETEAEEEFNAESPNHYDNLPPLPPPKETKGTKAGTRPPQLKLDVSQPEDDDRADVSQIDSADLSEEFSHEDELVESTSHSTYIAPALPPIRFSVVGADFSDILKSVNGGQQDLAKTLDTITNGKTAGVKLDLTVTPPPTASPAQPLTPTNNQTTFPVDVTPVQRRDPQSARGRSPSPETLSFHRPTVDLDPQTPRKLEDGLFSAEPTMLRSVSSPEPRNGLSVRPPVIQQARSRDRGNSNASLAPLNGFVDEHEQAQITVTPPETMKTGQKRPEIADIIARRLRETIQDARDRGATHVKLETGLIEATVSLLCQRQEEFNDMKQKLDGAKVST